MPTNLEEEVLRLKIELKHLVSFLRDVPAGDGLPILGLLRSETYHRDLAQEMRRNNLADQADSTTA